LTRTESLAESRYAWTRLAAALALMTIGGSGMYAVTVVLPRVQADFGIGRADASLPYTFTMIGFGLGGILMGRLADRYGVMVPVIVGALGLCTGFVAAGSAGSIWQFNLAQGMLIGLLGTSATFAPLVADISLWFTRRRGIAVAICISGNYLAGTIWPPLMQHYIDSAGWRQTFVGIGLFCLLTTLPLALFLRPRPPVPERPAAGTAAAGAEGTLGLAPGTLLMLLCVAGVACCVAMSMPQVHIVA
jgi:MFS family permease